jgi:hypothetical protein
LQKCSRKIGEQRDRVLAKSWVFTLIEED